MSDCDLMEGITDSYLLYPDDRYLMSFHQIADGHHSHLPFSENINRFECRSSFSPFKIPCVYGGHTKLVLCCLCRENQMDITTSHPSLPFGRLNENLNVDR